MQIHLHLHREFIWVSILNMSCNCLRWSVCMRQLMTDSELFERHFRRAIQTVQIEESDRIRQFRYKDDVLSSLIGRLLLRRAVVKLANTAWREVSFSRTDKGKPYLLSPFDTDFGLNISHQGDFVVIATSCTKEIGVDVMAIERNRGEKTADEFVTSMKRSFSIEEMDIIRSQPTDTMKMTYFYRLWCLKESLIKALGTGIHTDLSSINFNVSTRDRYRPGCCLNSTMLEKANASSHSWVFEESFLDRNHCVAVCRQFDPPSTCRLIGNPSEHFSNIDLDFLMSTSELLNSLPYDGAIEWSNFVEKPCKPKDLYC